MDEFERLLSHLARGAFEAAFDPPVKEVFRVRPRHSGAITRVLNNLAHDELRRFRSPKSRDDFLLAALRYLEPLPHEELITAVGTRRGSARNSGARLRCVHKTVGYRDRVPMTLNVATLLEAELARDGAEVLIVHNHPPRLLKSIIRHVVGWRPIPSTADRALMYWFLQSRVGHLLTSSRRSSFKWYLVDEGELGEFVLPPLDVILRWIATDRGT